MDELESTAPSTSHRAACGHPSTLCRPWGAGVNPFAVKIYVALSSIEKNVDVWKIAMQSGAESKGYPTSIHTSMYEGPAARDATRFSKGCSCHDVDPQSCPLKVGAQDANLKAAFAPFYWIVYNFTEGSKQEVNNTWLKEMAAGMKDENIADDFRWMLNLHPCLHNNGHIIMDR